MLSYHNDDNLKKMMIAEMKKHQEQDQFVKGAYGNIEDGKFKGCAVGCAIDSMNKVLGKSYDVSHHRVFEEAIGVPKWLALLQDKLFERLPENENSQFAVDLLSTIPVGVNLEPVKWKFCAFLMQENIDRVIELPNLSEHLRDKIVNAIRGVLKLNESAISSGKRDEEEAEAVAQSARAALLEARSAAESAAWSALSAAESALSAAESARSAAESAAWSAFSAAESEQSAAESEQSAAESEQSAAESEQSAAESAAWSALSAAYGRYAAELIRILSETK